MNRGHETASHLAMKRHVANVLRQRGWVVRFEAQEADVVGFRPGTGQLWAFECERSPKWVVRNVTKDLDRGAGGGVVVASTPAVAERARRAVARQLATIGSLTRVVIVGQFTDEFVKSCVEGTVPA